ncbi:hypothetical protein CFIO01_12942 [Colletotrichum fioriniae PJ7]|uniref:Ankyrin repeat protein n=1 Tax=Colletotrichum fioriniae PJ7 TaxID=1445577 RepID=A0A010QAU4_9PEZI|nr:hypothetical protein CFIO01_12942 [Colletotrichum fioriniae PJ7]
MAGSAEITQLLLRQIAEANASADSFGNVAGGHWYSSSPKDGPTALHIAVSTNCGAETLSIIDKRGVTDEESSTEEVDVTNEEDFTDEKVVTHKEEVISEEKVIGEEEVTDEEEANN